MSDPHKMPRDEEVERLREAMRRALGDARIMRGLCTDRMDRNAIEGMCMHLERRLERALDRGE